MGQDIRSRLYNDERIRRLVARKQRFAFTLALLVLAIHFGYVIAMAFTPGLLSAHLVPGGIEAGGLFVTFILLLIIYGIMFVFVRRKIAENNADVRELVEQISNE